jgi:acetyl-CoA carboxylase, biotin carboxylase subunit
VGDKLSARRLAKAAGVPMTAGSEKLATAAEAVAFAEGVGFPVVIKASAGGGGRGMVVARDASALADGFERASIEAKEAFGDGTLFVERARHVEVQVLGLGDGRVLHFGERDCSLQRRYQKMVEEAPAAALPEPTRRRLHKAAVDLLASIRYRNAGTVEFLYDVERDDFYFMEVNARIQVEHPVSEMITGVEPHQAPTRGRGRRDVALSATQYRLPWPCDRGAHHRREPGPRLCAIAWPHPHLAAPAWARHTARHGNGGGRQCASLLRQHDRQAYRPRA